VGGRRGNSTRFVAFAAIAAIGGTMTGVGAAAGSARATSSGRGAAVVVPQIAVAGSYQASFPAEGLTSVLVITARTGVKNAGTFQLTDFGDYGNWVLSGKSIGFVVASSAVGHAGRVLLGTATATGISPGAYGVAGTGLQTWSATRSTAQSTSAAPLAARTRRPLALPAKAPGIYTAQFPDVGQFDTLTVKKDTASAKEGTFTLSTLADSGQWVQLGKQIALGISSGEDAGVVMLGTLSTTGISAQDRPGLYAFPTSPTYHWYATKA
jgi:hypothetical protein